MSLTDVAKQILSAINRYESDKKSSSSRLDSLFHLAELVLLYKAEIMYGLDLAVKEHERRMEIYGATDEHPQSES